MYSLYVYILLSGLYYIQWNTIHASQFSRIAYALAIQPGGLTAHNHSVQNYPILNTSYIMTFICSICLLFCRWKNVKIFLSIYRYMQRDFQITGAGWRLWFDLTVCGGLCNITTSKMIKLDNSYDISIIIKATKSHIASFVPNVIQ
jgi:hypothetical protein